MQAFRDAIRSRDGRCVVTKAVALGAQYDEWTGFEAAHIFRWLMKNTGRIIILPAGSRLHQLRGVKSILYRMGYYLTVLYLRSLTRMNSRLIQTYVSYNPYEDNAANFYFRLVTKLCTSALIIKRSEIYSNSLLTKTNYSDNLLYFQKLLK